MLTGEPQVTRYKIKYGNCPIFLSMFVLVVSIHLNRQIMKEYLLLLRGGKPMATKTEAENKAEMEAWGKYMGGLGEKGQLAGGLPLVSGGAVVTADGVTNEPVQSAAEGIVGGYLIVKADNLEQATAIAKECPHIANEGNVEVREIDTIHAM